MEKKSLGEVLSVMRWIPTTTGKSVEGIPVNLAQLRKGRLTSWKLAFRSNQNPAPARGAKAPWITRYGVMLRIQLDLRARSKMDKYFGDWHCSSQASRNNLFGGA